MRARVICSFAATSLLLLSIGFGAHAGRPDIGGGSNRVQTPYKYGSAVTLKDVTTVKSIASKSRTITDVVKAGTHITETGENVALMYVRGDAATGTPLYQIAGTTDSGAKQSIDFSEIESFVVSKDESNASTVLIDVQQFPAISAAELLEKKPTYTDLTQFYSRKIRLKINTAGPRGTVLALVVKNPPAKGYKVAAQVSDLAGNSQVKLGYGVFSFQSLPLPAIWWATESVTSDSKYPYRVKVRARR